MKKIVALVLSLVMVLGLATTAMATTTTSAALYDLHKADVAGTEVVGDTSYVLNAATKNEATSGGTVAYYVIGANWYVEIAAADATVSDFYLTKANEKTPLVYLAYVGATADIEYSRTAVEFTDFGLKCGQMNVPYTYTVAELGFYTYTDPVTKAVTYYVEEDTSFTYTTGEPYFNGASIGASTNILVDGEVIAVKTFAPKAGQVNVLNQHAWSPVAYDKTVPTKALCGLCGTEAVVYKTGKAPAGSLAVPAPFGAGAYELVIGAPATSAPVVDGDKVESAETFDAGIAMYVGMSVMAAAGSAVVLKKKD